MTFIPSAAIDTPITTDEAIIRGLLGYLLTKAIPAKAPKNRTRPTKMAALHRVKSPWALDREVSRGFNLHVTQASALLQTLLIYRVAQKKRLTLDSN